MLGGVCEQKRLLPSVARDCEIRLDAIFVDYLYSIFRSKNLGSVKCRENNFKEINNFFLGVALDSGLLVLY